MRQIGTAMMLYMQDYDEVLLPVLTRTGVPRQPERYNQKLWISSFR
jgi:hypothetical protein